MSPLSPVDVAMYQARNALKKLDKEEVQYYKILSANFKAESSKELNDEQKQDFTTLLLRCVDLLKETQEAPEAGS